MCVCILLLQCFRNVLKLQALKRQKKNKYDRKIQKFAFEASRIMFAREDLRPETELSFLFRE